MDDLEDISDLEGYVKATQVMLFFISKQYFASRNCLREVRDGVVRAAHAETARGPTGIPAMLRFSWCGR